MAVEIRMDVDKGSGGVSPPERFFHFTCLGNFSGSDKARTNWEPKSVTRNSWDKLFEELAPTLDIHVVLPGVNDLKLSLAFKSLKDFGEKGLAAGIPFLRDLKAFAAHAGSASKERPFDAGAFCREHPDLSPLQELARKHGGEQVIDLLSMVDIGDEEESGMQLPNLGACLDGGPYKGEKRSALSAELGSITNMVLDQITGDEAFMALHGQFRALKYFLPFDAVRLSLIDCKKDELCDAVFTTFIKPDKGEPASLDLAVFCDQFGLSEGDHHIVYHLGRMAESLCAPFILNAAPQVLGCKTWGHLSHVRDISGRVNGPAHIKWRKLRDGSGAHWLFMAVNPFRLDSEEGEHVDRLPTGPASYYPALLVAQQVTAGKWPADLSHPGYQMTALSRCVARLDESQGYDLSFEGFCPISGKENGDRLHLMGMMAFGLIKMPAREKLEAGNLVEYTLSYRFFSGCCSRFLQERERDADLLNQLKTYAGLKEEGDLQYEEAEGQRIFRLKAPFLIFGVQPDLIMALG